MKITITKDRIKIETDENDMPIDHENKIDWSCRLASIEAMAWGCQQLAESVQKSIEFYRTGKHEKDKVSID